jgi:hypothetical protein
MVLGPKAILGSPAPLVSCYAPLTLSTDYNGANQEVDYGPVAKCKPQRTDPFTCSIWFKTVDQTGIMFSQMRTSIGWLLRIQSDGLAGAEVQFIGPRHNLQPIDIRSSVAGGAPSVNDGQWHHAAVTCVGNDPLTTADQEMYIDGALLVGAQITKSGGAVTNSTQNALARLYVANQDQQISFFPGRLCHASWHDFAMSAAQVLELYGSATPGLGCPQDLNALSFAAPEFWDTLGDGDACGAGAMLDLGAVPPSNGTMQNCLAGQWVADVPP